MRFVGGVRKRLLYMGVAADGEQHGARSQLLRLISTAIVLVRRVFGN
jgi:hypothetical protein